MYILLQPFFNRKEYNTRTGLTVLSSIQLLSLESKTFSSTHIILQRFIKYKGLILEKRKINEFIINYIFIFHK